LKFELTTDGKLVPFAISPDKDPIAEFNNTMHNHDIALTRVHRRALPQLRIIPDSIQDTLLTMIHGGIREIRQLHRIAVRHFYAFEKEKNDEVDASSLDATSSSSASDASSSSPEATALQAEASNILPFDRSTIKNLVRHVIGDEPVDDDLAKLCVLLGKREGLSWTYRDGGAGG
jgi:hypothetical protein